MKDLIGKLTELEATAPKAPAGKKMLTEDSTTPAMPKKPSLKDVFNELSENVAPGQKPLPVLDPQNKKAGMGFVTSTNPAVQNMLKNLDPKDVQIVQAPGQQPQQQQQPNQQQQQQQQKPVQQQTAQPNQAGATGQPQQGQMQMKEKDEGKPGKNFAKIAKSAGKRYGSKEAGERVAGAIRAKLMKQGKLEEVDMEEGAGAKDWHDDMEQWALNKGRKNTGAKSSLERAADRDKDWALSHRKSDTVKEGAKVDRMVKHIEKSERKLGKSKEKASDIAWATANKRGMLDNKNKKVKEGDIPSTQGIDTKGAGLGAGRSMTTLEAKEPQVEVIDNAFNRENYKDLIGKKYPKSKAPAYARVKEISEGKKPDFLDLDKDGNKKEPMKKAAADKKKKKVTESAETTDIGYQLQDLAYEIKELADNAMRLVRGTEEEGRARSYWYPHIVMAVSEDHGYMGKSMFTMMDSAESLIKGSEDEEDTFESKKTKKKKVNESMNHRISAARLEGKSHGLRGHAHSGKRYEDLEELRAYHEGYKEGLDECYGQGVYETAPAATVGGMASQALDEISPELASRTLGKRQERISRGMDPGGPKDFTANLKSNSRLMARAGLIDHPEHRGPNDSYPNFKPAMEDEMDEGNAFTAALAKTPKGGKFSVGGKTFTDRSNYDSKMSEGEFAFESWEKQLKTLVNEGLSVSVSKGHGQAEDSVNINATGAESEELLKLVKHAGLGLFGDEAHHEPSSAMSLQPVHGAADEVGAGGVDIDVVDGSDGMLGLIKKLSGVQASGSEDYADEAGHGDCGCEGECDCNEKTDEATCNECGMMEGMHESGCSMGKGKEMVDEVESEDQMAYEVAEDNAPDSGEKESTADEDAEAKEDQALAGADSKDEEEVNESFFEMLQRLDRLSEGTSDKAKHPEHDKKDDKDYDDAEEDEEDVTESEELNEWANQVGKGPGKGSDAQFTQDIDFMTKVISGGLNKPKSTGQTTVPVIAGQEDRMHDSPKDWATLAGIKKA